MKKYIVVIALFSLVMAGCATVGKEIHQANVDQLQNGKTTKAQVIQTFGQPDTTYFDKDGRLVFSYFASKVSPTVYTFIPIVNVVHNEIKQKNQMLVIMFSKDGVVEDYSFTNPDKTISAGIVP